MTKKKEKLKKYRKIYVKQMFCFVSTKLSGHAVWDKLSSFKFSDDFEYDKNQICVKISMKTFGKLCKGCSTEDQLKIKGIIPCYSNIIKLQLNNGREVMASTEIYQKNCKTILDLSKQIYVFDDTYILFTKIEDWNICNECFSKRLHAPVDTTECPICMEDLGDSNMCVTECGHKYHTSCLMKWLQKENTCPSCKHELTESRGQANEFYKKYPILTIVCASSVGVLLSPFAVLFLFFLLCVFLWSFLYNAIKKKLYPRPTSRLVNTNPIEQTVNDLNQEGVDLELGIPREQNNIIEQI
jgi:hypothetical protein